MKNIKCSALAFTVLMFLTLAFAVNVQIEAAPLIDAEQLPYKYEFTQKYIVAGERVLNLTITNNTSHNIEALEFEARLLDAFGDVISDWSTFSNPDLKIPSGSSSSLTLTLSKKNILGINIENVLDRARSFELRYARILLDDGTILRKDELYPNIARVYGDFKVQVSVLDNLPVKDDKFYNFTRTRSNEASLLERNLQNLSYRDRQNYEYADRLDDLKEMFGEKAILTVLYITNVSNQAVSKTWGTSFSSSVQLMDDAHNQYNEFARLYAPQLMTRIAKGEDKLLPGATLTIVYVFDKLDGYDPKEIEVYIDGQKYVETFKLR